MLSVCRRAVMAGLFPDMTRKGRTATNCLGAVAILGAIHNRLPRQVQARGWHVLAALCNMEGLAGKWRCWIL